MPTLHRDARGSLTLPPCKPRTTILEVKVGSMIFFSIPPPFFTMHVACREKQKVVKALYAGNEQTMLRESLGVVTEGANGVFMRKQVRQVFDTPAVPIPPETRHIYTAIGNRCGVFSTARNLIRLQIRTVAARAALPSVPWYVTAVHFW